MEPEPESIARLVSEWMLQYPNGTRILFWDNYLLKKWLPGVITGFTFSYGHATLDFRLDTDKPKAKPRVISYENRELIKKE